MARLIVRREERDRAARLRQPVGLQVAAIFGDELLDLRRCYLREEIVDLLVVAAGPQRFYDFPVVGLLFQFHFARGCLDQARVT